MLAGRYRSEELDTTFDVAVRDGRLVLSSLRRPEPVAFTPSAADIFDASFARLKVRRDGSGRAVALLLDPSGGRVVDLRLARQDD